MDTKPAAAPTYLGIRWLFVRLLALAYLAAFLSLAVQVEGLVGSQGILPAHVLLDWVRPRTGLERYWIAPTLFWLGSGDVALTGGCIAGAVLAGGPPARLAPIPLPVLFLGLLLSVNVRRPGLPGHP